MAVVLLSLAASGCGSSSLQRGAEFYSEKRYIDAAQVFEHTEPQLPEYDAAERATYAVYRGATLLALGNRAAARYWLGYGARMQQVLSGRDRVLLQDSLRAVDAPPASVPVLLPAASEIAGVPLPTAP